MNLSMFLEKSARRVPGHVALRFEGNSFTYQELNLRVNRVANGLRSLGLERGDRCILMMQSTPEFIMAYYALARLGAVSIPVNFLYKRHELSYIFRDCRAKGFIGMTPFLDEPVKVLEDLPHLHIRVAVGVGQHSGFMPFEDVDGPDMLDTSQGLEGETATVIYTSGTTGFPKGAMLSHGNLTSNAMTVADMRQTAPWDVVIGVLPLYHIFGQTSALNATFYLGLTFHLFRQFEPAQVIRLIESERSTVLFAVPTILNRLVQEADRNGVRRSSLRFCISGGASLPVEVLSRFEAAFDTTIYEGYGLSECSPVCLENPYGSVTKPGSIGLPIPGFRARIVDGSENDVEKGQIGELIVKGPGVMKGYLNRQEETARTIVDGWLHTGDLARQDEDGYFYIVDRKKDMIIRGGYNIYPREIEELLFQHPGVVEAAVYGVPDHDLGEEVVADVVLEAGSRVTEAQIREFVKERVAPYKYPRIVRLVEDLPKSHTGKVLKRELRKRYGTNS